MAEPSTDIKSRYHGDDRSTLDYTYELEGDTLTIWAGERGSPVHFQGVFSADGRALTGAWAYPGAGGYDSNAERVDQGCLGWPDTFGRKPRQADQGCHFPGAKPARLAVAGGMPRVQPSEPDFPVGILSSIRVRNRPSDVTVRHSMSGSRVGLRGPIRGVVKSSDSDTPRRLHGPLKASQAAGERCLCVRWDVAHGLNPADILPIYRISLIWLLRNRITQTRANMLAEPVRAPVHQTVPRWSQGNAPMC
jgi:hypothetical protein